MIDNELISNNEEIIIYFDFIIKELGLDSDKKDLIIFKNNFLSNFDKENAIERTLNPIIKSNSPVRNNAIKFLIKYYEGNGNQKSWGIFRSFKKK